MSDIEVEVLQANLKSVMEDRMKLRKQLETARESGARELLEYMASYCRGCYAKEEVVKLMDGGGGRVHKMPGGGLWTCTNRGQLADLWVVACEDPQVNVLIRMRPATFRAGPLDSVGDDSVGGKL